MDIDFTNIDIATSESLKAFSLGLKVYSIEASSLIARDSDGNKEVIKEFSEPLTIKLTFNGQKWVKIADKL